MYAHKNIHVSIPVSIHDQHSFNTTKELIFYIASRERPKSSVPFKFQKTLKYAKDTIVKILSISQCRKYRRDTHKTRKPFSPTENKKKHLKIICRTIFVGKRSHRAE